MYMSVQNVNDIYNNAAKQKEAGSDAKFVRVHKSAEYQNYVLNGRPAPVYIDRKANCAIVTLGDENIDAQGVGALLAEGLRHGFSKRLKDGITIDNSLPAMPSIYPTGLPMLAMQMVNIYRQEYYQGSYDENGKLLKPSDYMDIEQRPDRANWQETFFAKWSDNVDVTPDNLFEDMTNMPGQQVVNGGDTSDFSFQPVPVKNNMFARKIIKNTLNAQSVAMLGIDAAEEQMKRAVIKYALQDMYRTYVGNSSMPGLALLGNNQITLGTAAAQNLLGGFDGTTLVADLTYKNMVDIANGLLQVSSGLKDGSHVSWTHPVCCVSDKVFANMKKSLEMVQFDDTRFYLSDNRIDIYRKNGRGSIQPLGVLDADNRFNPTGKDTMLFYNKSSVKKMEFQPFEMYSGWETGDGMNFACYMTAQNTQPYLIDNTKMYRFVAA